ncbi:MAG TPA: alkaline phosphatase family protein [Longimicrobiales bacterium]|nr:alkaline phosphatase family protein [Longimicrobiales bacterium]
MLLRSIVILLAVASTAATAQTIKPGAVSSHVVVISIDGLRPDAIAKYHATTLLRLQREGATAPAQTILPSKTLPSHTSMVTGVTPAVHGITWNSEELDEYGYVRVPTVFELAHLQGFTTAAFFSKAKLRHLQKPGTLDYTQAPRGEIWDATRTVADVQHYLKFHRPNVLFVHIGEPDYAGHSLGWMGPLYGWAVRRADAAVARMLASAEATFGTGNYTVIVTADHGGHGRDHGSDDQQDTAIPWIVWGRGVASGAVADTVNTTDTAATMLWLLGAPPPLSWSGRAVASAFTTTARLAAESAIAGAGLKAAGPR